MIHTRTVFIVGAGASSVYGLPTGAELLEAAREQLETPGEPLRQWIEASGFPPLEVVDFWKSICRYDGPPSLDDYLSTQQEHKGRSAIGRAVIAAVLARFILTKRQQPADHDDWLLHVIRKSIEGATTLEQFRSGAKALSFVTFNFDSLIETRFKEVLSSVFEQVTKDALPPVYHVNGKLPPFPTAAFGNPPWLDWLRQAAASLHVVFDDVDDDVVIPAREAIRKANVICCLGFSYHRRNMAKVGLDLQPITESIFGSAVGMEAGERATATQRFGHDLATLDPDGRSCRQVLRHYHVFPEPGTKRLRPPGPKEA